MGRNSDKGFDFFCPKACERGKGGTTIIGEKRHVGLICGRCVVWTKHGGFAPQDFSTKNLSPQDIWATRKTLERAAHRRLCDFLSAAPAEKQGMSLPAPQGALAVENLVLAVPGTDIVVLRGVSFALQPGESLAVIGPSAAGKSSLARALLGIWPPRGGAVRLDGADLARIPRDQVGQYLGYLPQDVELFEGTVAENIARLGAVDSDKVVAAARDAGLHDLILHLPEGYDTALGPGGRGLSPGQRQRVGLARALYGATQFVVLDEPNSNLDADGEAALAMALGRLREKGVTTVIITHRANILAAVDKILLMRAGAVEAFGRRDEILPRLTRPAQPPRPITAIAKN
jgi:ABC-type protease/lipase transport system fused ATPase/permease subunit